ncbi:MAG: NHLP bacteriocin system secretion protein [Planctomycetes bacterium]|nr:NHLP bacteriocin system secretion protein [Planctomycetota bacterium]
MAESMFRKKALGKLQSPEQLDELMKVTRPRGWVALLALCAVVATAVLWGIFGRIPTRVNGEGMLIRPTGVFNVPSNGAGPVARMLVAEGDMIKANQVIAEITQVDLLAQIEEAKNELALLQEEHKKVLDYCERQRKLKMAYYLSQRQDLESDIKEQNSLVAELKRMVANMEGLRKRDLVSEQELNQSRQSFIQAQMQIRTLDDQLNSIPTDKVETEYNLSLKAFSSEKAVDDVKRKIQLLDTRLKHASQVVSPYEGRVLEVMVDEGTVVNIGTAMLSVEMLNQTMEAAIFISDTQGKKVQKSMMVEITPATVKREEYGYIVARVKNVSEFPATRDGMMRLLHNETLVNQLSRGGVPIQVNASLEVDKNTPSGYKWSSRKGPRLHISSGTLCTGSVVVQEQPPITLVIPFFKKFFGLT